MVLITGHGSVARSEASVRLEQLFVKSHYTTATDLAGPAISGHTDSDNQLLCRVAKVFGIVVAQSARAVSPAQSGSLQGRRMPREAVRGIRRPLGRRGGRVARTRVVELELRSTWAPCPGSVGHRDTGRSWRASDPYSGTTGRQPVLLGGPALPSPARHPGPPEEKGQGGPACSPDPADLS